MRQDNESLEKKEAEKCHTRQINDNFSNCLTEGKRYRCNHAFLFGDGYLCTHPRHKEFR